MTNRGGAAPGLRAASEEQIRGPQAGTAEQDVRQRAAPARRGLSAAQRAGLSLFLLTFAVRAPLVWWMHPYSRLLRSEVQNIPISLATTGHYSDPFGSHTGPTAHYTPVYPLLLAASFKIFGTGMAGELAEYGIGITFAALLFGFLPAFARLLGLPLRVGAIAGAMGALIPAHLLSQIRGGDGSLSGLLMMALAAVLLAAARGELRTAQAARCGLLLGLSGLTNPAILAAAGGLFGLAAWRNRGRAAEMLRYGGVAAALCCAVLTPWTVRNYFALGSPVVLRSNLGLELWVSNNDLAGAKFLDDPFSAAMKKYHPYVNPAEAARVHQLGEVAYNRQEFARFTGWVKSHPGRFLQLTAQRFVLFWLPTKKRAAQTAALGMLTLAAFWGMALLWRGKREVFWIVACIWLTYPDLFYLVQSWDRYRMPIQWTFLLCAAVAAAQFLRKREEPHDAARGNVPILTTVAGRACGGPSFLAGAR